MRSRGINVFLRVVGCYKADQPFSLSSVPACLPFFHVMTQNKVLARCGCPVLDFQPPEHALNKLLSFIISPGSDILL